LQALEKSSELNYEKTEGQAGISIDFSGTIDKFKWVEKYYWSGLLCVTHLSSGGVL
jgi:hypothetical protein